jgi:hypothetical protein
MPARLGNRDMAMSAKEPFLQEVDFLGNIFAAAASYLA